MDDQQQQSLSISTLLDSSSESSQVSHDDGAHTVQFYETDEALLGRLSEFVGSALGSGHACLVIATADHGSSLIAHLAAFGIERPSSEGRRATDSSGCG